MEAIRGGVGCSSRGGWKQLGGVVLEALREGLEAARRWFRSNEGKVWKQLEKVWEQLGESLEAGRVWFGSS